MQKNKVITRKQNVIFTFNVYNMCDSGNTIASTKKQVKIKHTLIYKGDICQNYFIPYNRMNKKINASNGYSLDLKIFFELYNIETIK